MFISMDKAWVIFCLSIALALPSDQCPEQCSCSDMEENRILVNCSALGLEKLPSHTGFQEFELSGSDVEIDLSDNRMTEAHFPPSLQRVSRITLAGNEIGATKNVEISALESLKELDLSGNKKLEKLSKDFGNNGLEVLTVSGCSVNEIEEGFLQRIPALKSLDLSCNALTELTSLFPSRPRSLDGSGDSWRAHQLTRLNVSHNEIHMMHEKGLIGTAIKVLDVSHNNVAHFRFTLYLQHLVELYISNNKLKNLEGMTLPNANVLDVSKNELRDFRVDFAKRAPKLKTLNLSHNPITRIPKISSYSITDLDLSYCSVSSVEPEAFSNLEGLQRLNLVGNELTSLRYELLHGADNLQFLLLAGNPWKCDCKSEEFVALHRLVLVDRAYTDGEDLQCHNDRVIPWSEACRGSARNDDLYLSSRTAFYAVIYLFSALFGILAAIFCYRCLRNLRQSDAVIFRNDEAEVNDREDILVGSRDFSDIPYIDDPLPTLSLRRSTPPPNYETAVALPALTEEQREMALSTLSLQKIT